MTAQSCDMESPAYPAAGSRGILPSWQPLNPSLNLCITCSKFTMFGGIMLWGRRAANWCHWRNAHALVIGWTVMALAGAWLSGYHGLFQRVLLAGWYGWLWIVFREIERQRQDATVTDTPLQS